MMPSMMLSVSKFNPKIRPGISSAVSILGSKRPQPKAQFDVKKPHSISKVQSISIYSLKVERHLKLKVFFYADFKGRTSKRQIYKESR